MFFDKTDNSKRHRWIWTGLAAACGLIWSFTNWGYDCGYQLAMSYRFLQGDRMFLEMWEPHQMSVFLPAALMWVYMSLFHTTTGIVVYLQICGILIRALLAFCLYKMLRNDLDEPLVYGMSLLYFMLSPKDYAMPDFSNQQLWYITLLFCSLLIYFKKRKLRYLLGGAFALCLAVMSYPSCAILLFGVIFLLFLYSPQSGRDTLIFTGICAGLGAAFCIAALPEPDVLRTCLRGMTALEPTHTVSVISKLSGYLKNIVQVSLSILTIGILGWGMSLPIRLILGKKGIPVHREQDSCRHWIWLLCCAVVMLAAFLLNILSAENRGAYGVIFLSLIGFGLCKSSILQGRKRQIYICGSVLGGLEFLATLILTDDLTLTDSAVYGLLAILPAFIPIAEQMKKNSPVSVQKGLYRCAMCFILLLTLRCVYIRTPLTGYAQICSIFSDLSIVRTGPASGLISDEDGVCIQRDTYPEWQELIRPEDKVWIIGSPLDNMQYLYNNARVAGPSTMSTPSYNSAILDYWRLNPDKYPDVIAAAGYLGELAGELRMNAWLMDWLENEYQPAYTVEGIYWIYYFKEER